MVAAELMTAMLSAHAAMNSSSMSLSVHDLSVTSVFPFGSCAWCPQHPKKNEQQLEQKPMANGGEDGLSVHAAAVSGGVGDGDQDAVAAVVALRFGWLLLSAKRGATHRATGSCISNAWSTRIAMGHRDEGTARRGGRAPR